MTSPPGLVWRGWFEMPTKYALTGAWWAGPVDGGMLRSLVSAPGDAGPEVLEAMKANALTTMMEMWEAGPPWPVGPDPIVYE